MYRIGCVEDRGWQPYRIVHFDVAHESGGCDNNNYVKLPAMRLFNGHQHQRSDRLQHCRLPIPFAPNLRPSPVRAIKCRTTTSVLLAINAEMVRLVAHADGPKIAS